MESIVHTICVNTHSEVFIAVIYAMLDNFIFAYFLHQFRSNVAAYGYKQVLFIEWETLLDRSDASFELLIILQEYILPIIYRKCTTAFKILATLSHLKLFAHTVRFVW